MPQRRQSHRLVGKLVPPSLPSVLPRSRLLDQLDGARSRPIIWLMGPPGAGKTTLIASYLCLRKAPCLWYQLDEGDRDVATFFHYLSLAASKAAPRHRRSLPHLTPEYRGALPIFARRFFEDLSGRLKPPCFIVFDNYHDVPADSALHELMPGALSSLGQGITSVLISRSQPPPTLATLRARQSCTRL